MTCKKTDCPIFQACDQEVEQAYYCRKVELLVHLSKLSKKPPRSAHYIKSPSPDFLN